MKQSNWMKGLLEAEDITKNLDVEGFTVKDINHRLLGILNTENREYLFNQDWVDGFQSYINHFQFIKGEKL